MFSCLFKFGVLVSSASQRDAVAIAVVATAAVVGHLLVRQHQPFPPVKTQSRAVSSRRSRCVTSDKHLHLSFVAMSRDHGVSSARHRLRLRCVAREQMMLLKECQVNEP